MKSNTTVSYPALLSTNVPSFRALREEKFYKQTKTIGVELVLEKLKKLWELVKGAEMPKYVDAHIKNDHVFSNGKNLEIITRNSDFYFMVHIEEMWLNNKRNLWKGYEPMVTIGSEFVYDKKYQTVPSVVGRTTLQKYPGMSPPTGMIYSHIGVVGPNPYKGGSLGVVTVLCKNKTQNYAEDVLKMIEETNTIFPINSMLGTYIQLANTIRNGIELIFKLGDTEPVIGKFSDYSLPNDSGYYVVTNIPSGTDIEQDKLWLINNKLYYGNINVQSPDDSLRFYNVFDDYDYIVYSVGLIDKRGIYETLPFYALLEDAINEVFNTDDWDKMRPKLIPLLQAINKSPDLTSSERESLKKEYVEEVKVEWNKKKDFLGQPIEVQNMISSKIDESLKSLLDEWAL